MKRTSVICLVAALVAVACATPAPATDDGTSEGAAGASAAGTSGKAGAAQSGAAGSTSGGASGKSAAGMANGGTTAAGGAGAPAGGSSGSSAGGQATGGSSAGGAATGGSSVGGAAGSSTAGSSTGGAATAGTGGGAGMSAGTLDPELSVPASGTPCSTPGSFSGCPNLEVCRISSETGGTCESCVDCGNLNASCTTSQDCDILFQCYAGKCRNICPLGTTYCGAPSNCLDVGHDTYGVCKN